MIHSLVITGSVTQTLPREKASHFHAGCSCPALLHIGDLVKQNKRTCCGGILGNMTNIHMTFRLGKQMVKTPSEQYQCTQQGSAPLLPVTGCAALYFPKPGGASKCRISITPAWMWHNLWQPLAWKSPLSAHGSCPSRGQSLLPWIPLRQPTLYLHPGVTCPWVASRVGTNSPRSLLPPP